MPIGPKPPRLSSTPRDDLYSRQPICETVQAVGGHFLFVAKPGSHPTLHDGLDGVELPIHEERVKKGRGFQTHRYRWLTNLPIRDGKDALTVNGLDIEIINTAGNVTYRNSFVTDLAVDRSNVAELAACGCAFRRMAAIVSDPWRPLNPIHRGQRFRRMTASLRRR